MYNLLNQTHNSIDGTFCYGFLQYAGFEYGTRVTICSYRCSQCGCIIKNLEDEYNSFGSSQPSRPHGYSQSEENGGYGFGGFGGFENPFGSTSDDNNGFPQNPFGSFPWG